LDAGFLGVDVWETALPFLWDEITGTRVGWLAIASFGLRLHAKKNKKTFGWHELNFWRKLKLRTQQKS